MPAPTQCTISGTFRDTGGNALSGVTVIFTAQKPFIHTTDNSLITNYQVTATSATDGTWSVAVVETTTPSVSLHVAIQYPLGSGLPSYIQNYYVTVPNTASATFASLISGQ